MPAGTVLVAADDGSAIDGAVLGAVLGIADPLAAAGVEEVGAGQVTGTDGRIGLERDIHQAELEQARPTGPAGGRSAWGCQRTVRGIERLGGRRGAGEGYGSGHGVLRGKGTSSWGLGGEALVSGPVSGQ